jgi:hypothetical protein
MRLWLGDGVYRLGRYILHGTYGDLVLGRVGVYIEASVWYKYTLMVKNKVLV